MRMPRFLFFLIGDILLVSFAVFFAFYLRFDGHIPSPYFSGTVQWTIILALLFLIPSFYYFRLYFIQWAYVSTSELIALWRAITVGFLLLGIAIFLLRGTFLFSSFPRATLVISYVLIFISVGFLRLGKRIYMQSFPRTFSGAQTSVIIVGAGDAGEQLVRSMLAPQSQYIPVCFVDDSKQKQGVTIHGVRVRGTLSDIPKLSKLYGAQELVIALPSASSQTIREAVNLGRQAGLKSIKMIPSLAELVHGRVSLANMREVQVEDLLGREPARVEEDSLKKFLAGKIVLITGAAGSIGCELALQIAKFSPANLLLVDQDETGIFFLGKNLKSAFPQLIFHTYVADILDRERMQHIFSHFHPSIVFHAAAYKHVPVMEEQPEEAVKNNIFGLDVVARAALANGAEKFIFISTDKAVNPTSVMGATKRVGEMLCQVLNQKNHTKFVSVRFGNVLNSRGSVIPIFREQIARGGPVEVTHPDMKRYFMLTSEACLLVLQASEMGQGGEVFVLDMGNPIKIVDLAKEMIRLSGFQADKDIPIVFIGKRPGEKLFEDLLLAEEGTTPTRHPKIFVAKLSVCQEQVVSEALKNLRDAVQALNSPKIIETLQKLIPSYHPSEI